MGQLKDKVGLITGAAGGIGSQTARHFVAEGARVLVADLDLEAAQQVADELGEAATAVQFDAADEESVRATVRAAVDTFGRLDILHNNVAITANAWHTDGPVVETPVDVWDRSWSVNVRSYVVAVQEAMPHLLKQGGTIINMASQAALRGSTGLAAYGTTKAAVAHLTRYLAVQYGRAGVRTNCIAPGVILTPQLIANAPTLEEATLAGLPWPRVGQAEDVANLVTFLASEQASFINGQVISVDGGASAGVDPRPLS